MKIMCSQNELMRSIGRCCVENNFITLKKKFLFKTKWCDYPSSIVQVIVSVSAVLRDTAVNVWPANTASVAALNSAAPLTI